MNESALFSAVERGDAEATRAMLAAEPDLSRVRDETGATALHVAAFHGHRTIVDLLLAAGADVNARDGTHGPGARGRGGPERHRARGTRGAGERSAARAGVSGATCSDLSTAEGSVMPAANRGGWKTCSRGHKYRGDFCPKCNPGRARDGTRERSKRVTKRRTRPKR